MRFRSRVAATAATLPLILGLAACGAEKTTITATGNAGSTPAPVSTPTPDAPPTTAPLKVAPAAGRLTTATFLPAMKKAFATNTTLRSSMRMVAGGQVMTVKAVQSATPLQMKLEMSGASFGGKATMIVTGGRIYVSMKNVSPAGKFVAVDPDDSSDPLAATFASMLDEMDPRKTFDAFDGGLISVEFVRSETVGGVELDRYAVTMDTVKALKAQGKGVVAGMPKTLVYSIWMDSDDLMRKVVFEMQGVKMTMTADDWGQPVSIKAPPARLIVKR